MNGTYSVFSTGRRTFSAALFGGRDTHEQHCWLLSEHAYAPRFMEDAYCSNGSPGKKPLKRQANPPTGIVNGRNNTSAGRLSM
jgi:hypothetical protein